MYRIKMRFSLIAVLFCLGLVPDTMAAPSVRKLGSVGTATGKVTSVKNIDSGTNNALSTDASVKKATTSKPSTLTGSMIQPGTRSASSRVGILGAKPVTKGTTLTGFESRFPSVSTKTGKIQSISKPVVTTETATAVNSEVANKVTNLESELQNNYYTKDQINTGFYGIADIDTKMSGIDTRINGLKDRIDSLNPDGNPELVQTVNSHTESINTLNGKITKVYDHATNQYTDVTIVTEFDESILSSN